MAVKHKAVVIPLQMHPHLLQCGRGVDIVLDQMGYAILLECHRRVHAVVLVKAESTGQPAVASRRAAQHQVLGDALLVLTLGESEVALRQKVLVERHVVAQIVESGDGGKGESGTIPTHCDTVSDTAATVEHWVVIVDLARLGRGIGISALINEISREDILDIDHARRTPHRTPSQRLLIASSGLAAIIEVAEVAALIGIVEVEAHGHFPAKTLVEPDGVAQRSVGSHAGHHAHPLIVHGRYGVDIHQTGYGVATVERGLRTAQHFYALHIGHLEIESVFI